MYVQEAAVIVKAFGMFRASLPRTYPSGTHRASGESATFGSADLHGFVCSSGLQTIRTVARCNHMTDCHDFSDEVGCGNCSAELFACRGSDLCLKAEYQCDGVNDCPLSDDEENCETFRCPRGCSCGESPYNDLYGPLHPACGQSDWQPMWINCTNGWNEEYARNTTKKAILLYLESNDIWRLDDGCFLDLHSLFLIDFDNNQLTNLRPGVFKDLGRALERLVLTRNFITEVNATLFTGIENQLYILSFEGNPLMRIAPGTFKNLTVLENLYILARPPSPILLYPDIFDGLVNLDTINVYDQRICCISPGDSVCTLGEPAHPLFTCRMTLLQNLPIEIFIWILGISALIGNSYVIVQRLRAKFSHNTAKVQSVLILNLAISDFLMGIYLLILAIMDIVISDSYFWEGRAEEWRTSSICQAAGFISVISSETSVFLITIISLDRVISVLFPFSEHRLSVKSARTLVGATWGLALLLSTCAVVLNHLNPDAYGLSDVCVGLPLIRKNSNLNSVVDERLFNQIGVAWYATVATASESTWQFSIVLFLGVNSFCFSVVLIAYIIIFIWVRVTRSKAGRKDSEGAEIKMAAKMSLLVGTDFFCWMPIIILGILVQSSVITLSSDVYAWLVVFVLPINSSINPYLYTIVDIATRWESHRMPWFTLAFDVLKFWEQLSFRFGCWLIPRSHGSTMPRKMQPDYTASYYWA
ncbi:relaxin receptor 1-like [Diadema setosum]|uniref:relaxin receptor 1-like n=1 Tax=Diadema setosum TaxID=31175 RepID=UPI003B3AB5A4